MNQALYNVQERILSKDRSYILVKDTYHDCCKAYNDALKEKNKLSQQLVALNKRLASIYYTFKHATVLSIFVSIILSAFVISGKINFLFLAIEVVLCLFFSIIYFSIGSYLLHNKIRRRYKEWSIVVNDLYDAQFAAWQNLRVWEYRHKYKS